MVLFFSSVSGLRSVLWLFLGVSITAEGLDSSHKISYSNQIRNSLVVAFFSEPLTPESEAECHAVTRGAFFSVCCTFFAYTYFRVGDDGASSRSLGSWGLKSEFKF